MGISIDGGRNRKSITSLTHFADRSLWITGTRRLVVVISRVRLNSAGEHRRIITTSSSSSVRFELSEVATLPGTILIVILTLSLLKSGLIWDTRELGACSCLHRAARRVYNCRCKIGTTAYSSRFAVERPLNRTPARNGDRRAERPGIKTRSLCIRSSFETVFHAERQPRDLTLLLTSITFIMHEGAGRERDPVSGFRRDKRRVSPRLPLS